MAYGNIRSTSLARMHGSLAIGFATVEARARNRWATTGYAWRECSVAALSNASTKLQQQLTYPTHFSRCRVWMIVVSAARARATCRGWSSEGACASI